MKRTALVAFIIGLLLTAAAAQPGGKVAIECPPIKTLKAKGIVACPDSGCGERIDPLLNKVKNVRRFAATGSDRSLVELCRKGSCRVEDKDFEYLRTLPDPVKGYALGDTREKLEAFGEGKMIRIVAWALQARKGGKESCNSA
jgi:hypothetical protein